MEHAAHWYFDHAATSPLREVAKQAWLAHAGLLNPGGQYAAGRAARAALESAREQVAALLGCAPIEVIFTSSGTESNNIALRGIAATVAAQHADRPPHIASAAIEHPAVAETVKALCTPAAKSRGGAVCTHVPLVVDPDGIVRDTVSTKSPVDIATLMWANNETGAIQPVAEFAAAAAAAGAAVHIDATQAVGKIPLDLGSLPWTTVALSAHKFGGPRGVGVLCAKKSPPLAPVLTGGGQQRGIRPGTVDVAGAVATAAALAEAVAEIPTVEPRVRALRDRLARGIMEQIPDTVIHTPLDDPQAALAGHLHLSFPGAEADSLLFIADMRQIAVSSGSACHAGVNRPSDTLLAMGVSEPVARSAMRFTLGHDTTDQAVDYVLDNIAAIVATARTAGMA
ncbi:cysteine desulfurase family protein [Corynebacterium choanae]|uniref:Cysteine desulfurase n=1 Tax=Corynebacterium choanae TaxID=1862358 RepID=A0A3G6J5Y4_9CORY|nr:cysteine desulfurase family protein [Corynebacterium choanae]AZA13356.1 Cysteine desulfurase [Corynebacterium choanae]